MKAHDAILALTELTLGHPATEARHLYDGNVMTAITCSDEASCYSIYQVCSDDEGTGVELHLNPRAAVAVAEFILARERAKFRATPETIHQKGGRHALDAVPAP